MKKGGAATGGGYLTQSNTSDPKFTQKQSTPAAGPERMKILAVLPLFVLFMAAVLLPPVKGTFFRAQDWWDGIKENV